jgi:prepilin-type N-terminal cleavage/methylation domain-containing protein
LVPATALSGRAGQCNYLILKFISIKTEYGTDAATPHGMMTTTGGRERRGAGYTLVELVVVLAVVSVASALAYPSLAGLQQGQELEKAAVGMAQCLRLSHWRSVVSGKRVRVLPRQDPDGGLRLHIEREEGAVWVADGDGPAIPRGVILAAAGPAEKVFNPDGTCSLGSFTMRGAGGVYRCTLAPATGRVRLYRGDREVGRGL